jgi:glycosyltransferase involved in cell wall biosynthesis
MERTPDIHKVAFVADYPPRKCGIATFTADLRAAVVGLGLRFECPVAAVSDLAQGYDYPPEVRFEIYEQDLNSYQRAADFLNLMNADVVCVQHEFGIFGGPAGSHVLALLRSLRTPIVTTLHTILRNPSAEQRRVMQELIRLSTRLVVMTAKGEAFLREVYKAPADKIDLIPHGIPDMPFVDPNYFKDELGVVGKHVLLTFGLLSPNKGIEYVLEALPAIVREFPDVVYIVLGQTHPNLLRDQGERYRLSLERLAKDLGVQKHVVFFNRFVELEQLKAFIGAADIYLTPYLNEEQITSGTLSYAFGAGKAVISTPYWHAAELLAGDRGILVPFRNAEAIAQAVLSLLRDEARRHALRKNAYRLSREMVWSSVAAQYLRSFEQARLDHSFLGRRFSPIRTLDQQPGLLPELKLDHLKRLTDSTGLFQHAAFSVPNFAEGYCTDDNARALALMLQLRQLGQDSPQHLALTSTYAAFVHYAFDPARRRFRNFLGFDRRWRDEVGSEDAHARCLWALGQAVEHPHLPGIQRLAVQLFEQALPVVESFSSPRAWALTLLGLDHYLRRLPGDRLVNQMREQLVARMLQRYKDCAGPDWPWFEDIVSYANAKLPHALIVSGRAMNHAEALEVGLSTLRWLVRIQTSEKGFFRPVGSNGFYPRGGVRAAFDQQPIEARAMVSACVAAYRATGEASWLAEARRAFEWFLGRNELGLALYDSATGACHDGLHVDRINQNQGAESTLAFLLALTEMQAIQTELSSFKELGEAEAAPERPARAGCSEP